MGAGGGGATKKNFQHSITGLHSEKEGGGWKQEIGDQSDVAREGLDLVDNFAGVYNQAQVVEDAVFLRLLHKPVHVRADDKPLALNLVPGLLM